MNTDGSCAAACSPTASVDELNSGCFCLTLDRKALDAELAALLGAHGLPAAMSESHPNLFSASPVFISRRHVEAMAQVVAALEQVVELPGYQDAALAWAPPIARFDPGSPGGLLGLDFHLGPDGPRLIEINTNPGGVLLNGLLGQAQQACLPGRMASPVDAARLEGAVLETMLAEWQLERGAQALGMVAIVDEAPEQQFLYPEFLMFRELFRRHGVGAEICAPADLVHREQRLWLGDTPVDLIYNRLTDFSLQGAGLRAIRDAYLARDVVLSPHPRAHALYADKRNLGLLCDRAFLASVQAPAEAIDILSTAVPLTRLLTADNREAMWAQRRGLFFKPAAGYGSKASYRGDKLTHRVWDEIAGGDYVAQQVVAPSERRLASDLPPLKVDIRCYAYRGRPLLFAARMYQGQTTNFRTRGGGFAPVLSDVAAAAMA